MRSKTNVRIRSLPLLAQRGVCPLGNSNFTHKKNSKFQGFLNVKGNLKIF
jgi:hypothetical protein